MSESTRIHVVVDEGQKDDWDDFVDEEPGLEDRSELIRTAVSEYIADARSDSELPDEVERKFEEVMVQYEQLQSQMSFANEAFSELRESQLEEEKVEEIVEFHTGLVQEEIQELEAPGEGSDE